MKATRQSILIVFILLGALICIASFCTLLVFYRDWFPVSELARIDVGNDRLVVIYGDSCWEISRAIYFEAREGGRVIIPRTINGFDSGLERYTLKFVSAENQDLVGVFDPNKPIDDFFLIIDFKTGTFWPRFLDSLEVSVRKKNEFFERLQTENSNLKLPTLYPTRSLPTLPTAAPTPSKPTPTNTLVIQSTSTITFTRQSP